MNNLIENYFHTKFCFCKDERAVSKSEFANMLLSWDIEEGAAEKAYDFITELGKKKMDCKFNFKI
jgi:hypothetical protein